MCKDDLRAVLSRSAGGIVVSKNNSSQMLKQDP